MQRERSGVVTVSAVRVFVVMAALSAFARRAYADASDSKPSPVKYSAFDLARGKIPITTLSGPDRALGFVTMAGALLDCATAQVRLGAPNGSDASWLTVSTDPSASCVLFTSREPGTIKVRSTAIRPDGESPDITVDFNKGAPFGGSTWFDGALHLRPQAARAGASSMCFAYYSPKDSKWQTVAHDVDWSSTDPKAALPLSEPSGTVYAHDGACAGENAAIVAPDVTRMEYPAVVMRDLGEFNACNDPPTDAEKQEYEKSYGGHPNYNICIDQANALGEARITRNHEHYIQTFEFGRILIRHWRTVVPVVTIAGAGVSINQPGFAGPGIVITPGPTSGAPTTAPTTGGFALPGTSDGQGVSGQVTMSDHLISSVFIPPHAPGAMHIDIKFVDPGDAKPKAATAIDLAVDQGYSGSLRVGIAHVFGAQDHRFSKLQPAASLPATITETDTGTNEVVVGYSLYLDALLHGDPAGRTYAVYPDHWYAAPLRHLGLFVGFGALSYSPGNIDFLKSIHVGAELELTRNLSIAATAVGRRITQLGGNLHVGGLAPSGDLPTSSDYGYGFGLVFNFSTDFVKFATAAPTAGASK